MDYRIVIILFVLFIVLIIGALTFFIFNNKTPGAPTSDNLEQLYSGPGDEISLSNSIAGYCGDGICQIDGNDNAEEENSINCASDCGNNIPPRCRTDSICANIFGVEFKCDLVSNSDFGYCRKTSTGGGGGETSNVNPVCGNNVCESGENTNSCLQDCHIEQFDFVCGDGLCNSIENATNCVQDCAASISCSANSDCGNQNICFAAKCLNSRCNYNQTIPSSSCSQSVWISYPSCRWNESNCNGECVINCFNKNCGNNGCGGNCGNCGIGQSCLSGVCINSCTPNCNNKCGGVSDGCGGNCNGVCSSGKTCNNGQCVTPADACANVNCTDTDLCTVDSCSNGVCSRIPIECSSGRICSNGVCVNAVCTPDCEGKTCGASDGCSGTCSGSCPTGQSCNANKICVDIGVSNLCASVDCADNDTCTVDSCNPTDGSCSRINIECDAGKHCVNGDCVDNDCVLDCTGKTCGGDGCGGSCGECGADALICNNNQCTQCLTDSNCGTEETCDVADGICVCPWWKYVFGLCDNIPASCSDSDNGIEYYILGIVSQYANNNLIRNYSDVCFNPVFCEITAVNETGVFSKTVSQCYDIKDRTSTTIGDCYICGHNEIESCSGDDCFVDEVYCDVLKKRDSEYKCIDGCSDGACISDSVCSNGICESGEDENNCPADCVTVEENCTTNQDCLDLKQSCDWACDNGKCAEIARTQVIPCDGAVWQNYPDCSWNEDECCPWWKYIFGLCGGVCNNDNVCDLDETYDNCPGDCLNWYDENFPIDVCQLNPEIYIDGSVCVKADKPAIENTNPASCEEFCGKYGFDIYSDMIIVNYFDIMPNKPLLELSDSGCINKTGLLEDCGRPNYQDHCCSCMEKFTAECYNDTDCGVGYYCDAGYCMSSEVSS